MLKKILPVIMVLAIVTGLVTYYNVVVAYPVFEWSDLILGVLIMIITFALSYIGYKPPMAKGWLSERFRVNSLFAGFIMSLFRLYGVLVKYTGSSVYSGFEYESIKALKPLLISLLLYFMFREWVSGIDNRLSEKVSDIKEKDDSLNGEISVSKLSIISIGLTRREMEIIDLIYCDMTNKEIASELFISEATVKKHVQNILKKAGCANKDELRSAYENSSYK